MTLLTIVQNVADEVGIKRPSVVAAATDTQTRQLHKLVNRSGKFISNQYPWQALVKEATFTSVATESQGAMTTVAGADFRYVVNDTLWNRTLNRPIPGPLSESEWQNLKSSSITGPYQEYRIRGGNLILIPAPSAGDTIAFEYVSNYWCEDSGGTDKGSMTADTDVALLPEELLELDTIWRWKKAKGFDYAEDFRTAQIEIKNYQNRDGSKAVLMLDRRRQRRPGILVPDGSWNL